MTESQDYDELSDDQLSAIDSACVEFELALRRREQATIESVLRSVPAAIQSALFRELLSVELESRLSRDEQPNVAEYEVRFPNLSAEIQRVFAETEKLVACSHGSVQMLKAGRSKSLDRQSIDEEVSAANANAQGLPRHIGRYRLEQILGQGAFGVVYRAIDEQLDRVVAVKTPLDATAVDVAKTKAYLTEAQAVAALDHPHIVPVYDFGSTDSAACYIVSKYQIH